MARDDPLPSAALVIVGTVCDSIVVGPVIQRMVPSASEPASSSIFEPERGDEHRAGFAVDRAEREVRVQVVAVEVDGFTTDQGHEDREVLAHVGAGLRERVAEHVLDHDLVREADAEGEAVAGRRLHGAGLRREHHRVPRVGRHHCRAELDGRDLPADDGEGGERVDPEDLREPVRGEALLGCGRAASATIPSIEPPSTAAPPKIPICIDCSFTGEPCYSACLPHGKCISKRT